MKKIIGIIIYSLVWLLGVQLQMLFSQQSQQEVHDHGLAQMNLVLSGTDLEIEIISPAFNLLGYEHEPQNPDEKKVLLETEKKLDKLFSLIEISSEAKCSLKDILVENPYSESEEGHDEEDEEGHGDEEEHTDFLIHAQLQCVDPLKLKKVETRKFFNNFPFLEELETQWVTDQRTGADELHPQNTLIQFQ